MILIGFFIAIILLVFSLFNYFTKDYSNEFYDDSKYFKVDLIIENGDL